MGLRAAIPGLKAHDTVIALPPVVVSFDNEAAINIIRVAVLDVGGSFPAGSPWEWLKDNRPDVIAELRKAMSGMNTAYHAQDMEQVKAAADYFVRSHKKAWKLFEERPPIIERQDDLFVAAA